MSTEAGPSHPGDMTNGTQQNYPAWVKAYERRRALRATAGGIICVLVGLFLGLLLGGCAHVGSTVPVRDGQEQAVWIAWTIYGRSDMPPLVRWRQGADLDCIDTNSGKAGFPIPDPDEGSVCREGLTMSPVEVIVAWHGELSFSETALAHELAHAAMARALLFDPRHTRNEWWGDAGLVDIANNQIRAAGR